MTARTYYRDLYEGFSRFDEALDDALREQVEAIIDMALAGDHEAAGQRLADLLTDYWRSEMEHEREAIAHDEQLDREWMAERRAEAAEHNRAWASRFEWHEE